MRTVFDQKLDELHRDLLRLGLKTNEAISKAVKTFIQLDKDMAQEIIKEDKNINNMEREIEQKSTELIAVQQPNASDLRKIIAVLRATSTLERMADHAQNIAEATLNIRKNKRDEQLEAIIKEMFEKVQNMSKEILDAFVDFDVDKATEIAKRDIEVDKLYNELRMTTIKSMQKDPQTVNAGSDYAFIGMDLERIGDYVTNIAESIVYLDTGEVVDLNEGLKEKM
jgi:phosphate transport system protein